MKITIATGSRADWGLLEILMREMEKDDYFKGQVLRVWGATFDKAFTVADECFTNERPDLALVLGDRFEILAASTAAHLQRVPIAHIGGGDVTEGSYDDAMRDCITRMSSLHFVTSTQSEVRVQYLMGQKNVHLVGSPGVDFLMHGDWKAPRPYLDPYVVISYQPETIDGTNEFESILETLPKGKIPIFIMPNPDRGSEAIRERIKQFYLQSHSSAGIYDVVPHAEFLNLIYHCDEFIGNSSSMLYEAPFIGVKTRMIGRRQKGRVIPFGDGKACERIMKILKEWK